MKIKLIGQQYNHACEFSYHCIDKTHLVINGTLFTLADGVAWPNAIKESGGLIMSATKDSDGTVLELLCQYVSSYPSAEECAERVVTPEVIDTTGMEVVTISGQTQAEIDAASTKTTLEAECNALKAECDALDLAAVRPLRAVAAGTATDEDKTYMANNEAAVKAKRARIHEIKAALGE